MSSLIMKHFRFCNFNLFFCCWHEYTRVPVKPNLSPSLFLFISAHVDQRKEKKKRNTISSLNFSFFLSYSLLSRFVFNPLFSLSLSLNSSSSLTLFSSPFLIFHLLIMIMFLLHRLLQKYNCDYFQIINSCAISLPYLMPLRDHTRITSYIIVML